MLRHVEEVGADAFCILVKIVFTGYHPDPSKNLNSQSASRDSTNYIDCVLLPAHKITPRAQNVSTFFNVNVVFDSGAMSFEGYIELTLHTITFSNRVSEFSLETSFFHLLFFNFFSALANQSFTGLLFDIEF